jgi:hypothetical protein
LKEVHNRGVRNAVLYFGTYSHERKIVVTARVMRNLGDECCRVVKLQAAAALPTVHIELELSVETSQLRSVNSNI